MRKVQFTKGDKQILQIHPLTTTGWMPVLLLIVLNICVVRGIANLNRTLPSQSLPNNGKCLDFPGVFTFN